MLAAALLLAAGSATALAATGVRKARRQAEERRAIFALCVGSLANATSSIAPDGYPRLSGRRGGRLCRLAIIPDTLALRRLPQLWLTVSLAPSRPLPGLVVTARPRGDDYVSKAFEYTRQIDVPSWLPRDAMVRIDEGCPNGTIDRFREPLAALFSDPLVKELSLGPRGLRLVYRLAEGDRANHLLLRQCRFSARVDKALFDRLADSLEAIETAVAPPLALAA